MRERTSAIALPRRMVNPHLEQLARGHAAYARSLQTAFRNNLTAEDCADVVQDAFLDAGASATCRSLERPQLEAWLRKAMRHRALDLIKARDGQGTVKRPRPVNLDDLDDNRSDLADNRARFAGAIAEGISGGDDAEVVRDALAQLPPRDRQLLELRHRDGLSVAQCAERFAMTLKSFERHHTAAVKRLRELVVGPRSHDTCTAARLLIDRSQQTELSPVSVARRDAHLAGCLRCRAYDRRRRGLIAVLPLPLVTLVRRVGSEALRLVPGSGSAMPAAASGGLSVPATKLAALICTGLAAAGAADGVALHHRRAAATQTAGGPDHRSSWTVSAPTSAAAARKPTPAGQRLGHPESGVLAGRRTSVTNASRPASELKPPGHEVAAFSRGPRPALSPSTPSATTALATPSAGKPSAPVAVPPTTPADSSSGEFAPHP